MKNKRDIKDIPSDETENMFMDVYRDQVASENSIDEFDCKCNKDGKEIYMEVTVFGFAGSPTYDEYKKGKVKNASEIVVQDERGKLTFKCMYNEIVSLNSNDYMVVYRII